MQQTQTPIRVACIGDSITYGWGLGQQQNELSYPSLLQRSLGDSFHVGNFGNSGKSIIKSSMDGQKKRSYFFQKEYSSSLEFQPNIVISNLGINDLLDYTRAGDEFINDYKELLQSYLNLASQPELFVWNDLAPLMPGQRFHGSKNISAINHDINTVVQELNQSYSNRIKTINMGQALNDRRFFMKDKLHPNTQGYKKIAEVVFKALQK